MFSPRSDFEALLAPQQPSASLLFAVKKLFTQGSSSFRLAFHSPKAYWRIHTAVSTRRQASFLIPRVVNFRSCRSNFEQLFQNSSPWTEEMPDTNNTPQAAPSASNNTSVSSTNNQRSASNNASVLSSNDQPSTQSTPFTAYVHAPLFQNGQSSNTGAQGASNQNGSQASVNVPQASANHRLTREEIVWLYAGNQAQMKNYRDWDRERRRFG